MSDDAVTVTSSPGRACQTLADLAPPSSDSYVLEQPSSHGVGVVDAVAWPLVRSNCVVDADWVSGFSDSKL